MNILEPTAAGIDQAIDVLRRGGVVAHATETCYGLTCDLSNPAAIKKLFDIKDRPYDQPVSALFFSVEEASKYVEFSKRARELAEKHLPGPLTLVLPMNLKAPAKISVIAEELSSVHFPLSSTIGVRVSSHPLARLFAEKFGKPIATTSANVHGQPNPYSVLDLEQQFGGRTIVPDLILDSGRIQSAPPSTVVEVIGDMVKVLRQGDIHV